EQRIASDREITMKAARLRRMGGRGRDGCGNDEAAQDGEDELLAGLRLHRRLPRLRSSAPCRATRMPLSDDPYISMACAPSRSARWSGLVVVVPRAVALRRQRVGYR